MGVTATADPNFTGNPSTNQPKPRARPAPLRNNADGHRTNRKPATTLKPTQPPCAVRAESGARDRRVDQPAPPGAESEATTRPLLHVRAVDEA